VSVAARRDGWRETTVYQIYPRSFADGDGDGIGDLEGVISRLDYLQDLGVETLWLSPFFPGPGRDVGYDISDYRGVAPEYGTLETVDRLIEELHERDMKLVLDMVLNHTSDEHPWFVESRSSRDNPRRDWYVWRDGRRPGGAAPPNNWHAMIGGSGWHHDPTTDQWYWAQFLPFQPDLDYRNPAVVAEMLDTLRFWLDRGVDGFRLDIVNAIFEDPRFRDNARSWSLFPSDEDPSMLFQARDRTLGHPDTLAFMRTLRSVVDEYPEPARFLVGEVTGPMEQVRAHCGDRADGLNLAFLFHALGARLEAPAIRALIADFERLFPDPLLPTWVFANHDRMRRITRLGGDLQRAKLNAAWQLTARGVPFVYYGEEIGMEQRRIPMGDSRDALALRMGWLPQLAVDALRRFAGESINRDECRTPMQWSRQRNVGFCPDSVEPWLPPPIDPGARTVEAQRSDPGSLLACYRRFLHARREHPALSRGDLQLLPERDTGADVVGYRREADGRPVWVYLNASARSAELVGAAPCRCLVSTDATRGAWLGETLRLGPWEGLVVAGQDQS
jgi:alpha-glucosidase